VKDNFSLIRMLFLSLCFKALKHTVKASKYDNTFKTKKQRKTRSDSVSQLSLSRFPLFLDGYVTFDYSPRSF
jgi:hypothetical protein